MKKGKEWRVDKFRDEAIRLLKSQGFNVAVSGAIDVEKRDPSKKFKYELVFHFAGKRSPRIKGKR